MSVATSVVANVPDDWDEGAAAQAFSTLQEVVLASHLLGGNRAVSNFGGGNTSAKGHTTDHLGRTVAAMWVKGSGGDLATMGAKDFTPLRLDEILPLFERDEMSDEDMVAYLARCQIDPSAPRCSIETLLHAFVPSDHVHHTHPDAINVLACATAGRALIGECFGARASWIDYIRPGFTLAKQVGATVRENPGLELVVLGKHGLVVWGDTAEQAYKQTISICNEAADFVNARTVGAARFGGPKRANGLDGATREQTLKAILPTLRGAVSSERSKLLLMDLSAPAQELVDSALGATVATVGAACPDHLVHTKRVPMWVAYDPATDTLETLRERLVQGAEAFREGYRAYFERNAADGDVISDPDPRVVLIEGVGLVAVAPTLKNARISRDLYHRAIQVMGGASTISDFVSLAQAESFAIEYWPLELYKLSLAPAPGELQGKVALVTGAAGRIGRAIVQTVTAAGAAVVAFDLDGEGAEEAVSAYGDLGVAIGGSVTSQEAVAQAFEKARDAFGGVDIVVSNAGIASSSAITDTTLAERHRNHEVLGTGCLLVAREAFRMLEQQGRGGSIIFVASQNSLVAGPNASACSSAKAAELHLARCLAAEGGSKGIRVNTVNPDAVLQGSQIWAGERREERASARGIPPEELERHYRDRTVLRVSALPADIAQSVLHFASPSRSAKSTGNVLNVDGGVVKHFGPGNPDNQHVG